MGDFALFRSLTAPLALSSNIVAFYSFTKIDRLMAFHSITRLFLCKEV